MGDLPGTWTMTTEIGDFFDDCGDIDGPIEILYDADDDETSALEDH